MSDLPPRSQSQGLGSNRKERSSFSATPGPSSAQPPPGPSVPPSQRANQHQQQRRAHHSPSPHEVYGHTPRQVHPTQLDDQQRRLLHQTQPHLPQPRYGQQSAQCPPPAPSLPAEPLSRPPPDQLAQLLSLLQHARATVAKLDAEAVSLRASLGESTALTARAEKKREEDAKIWRTKIQEKADAAQQARQASGAFEIRAQRAEDELAELKRGTAEREVRETADEELRSELLESQKEGEALKLELAAERERGQVALAKQRDAGQETIGLHQELQQREVDLSASKAALATALDAASDLALLQTKFDDAFQDAIGTQNEITRLEGVVKTQASAIKDLKRPFSQAFKQDRQPALDVETASVITSAPSTSFAPSPAPPASFTPPVRPGGRLHLETSRLGTTGSLEPAPQPEFQQHQTTRASASASSSSHSTAPNDASSVNGARKFKRRLPPSSALVVSTQAQPQRAADQQSGPALPALGSASCLRTSSAELSSTRPANLETAISRTLPISTPTSRAGSTLTTASSLSLHVTMPAQRSASPRASVGPRPDTSPSASSHLAPASISNSSSRRSTSSAATDEQDTRKRKKVKRYHV